MKILTPEPRYNLTMIPETPDEFKQVLAELRVDRWYGCYFSIGNSQKNHGIIFCDGGIEIWEMTGKKGFWRETYRTPDELLQKCVHFGGRPLASFLGQMSFHPDLDCA